MRTEALKRFSRAISGSPCWGWINAPRITARAGQLGIADAWKQRRVAIAAPFVNRAAQNELACRAQQRPLGGGGFQFGNAVGQRGNLAPQHGNLCFPFSCARAPAHAAQVSAGLGPERFIF